MAKLDRKPAERLALWAIVVLLVVGGLSFYFWQFFGLNAPTTFVVVWQAAAGVLVALATLIHLRQSRLAEDEQEDFDRLQAERAAGGARGQLFEQDEIQAFLHRNRLRLFEKYFAPMFAVLTGLILLMGVLAVGVIAKLYPGLVLAEDKALHGVAAYIVMAFTCFLLAMYAAGMARQGAWRGLRAVAGYLMLITVSSVAVLIGCGLASFGYPATERVLGWVLLALMAIVAVEMLINFVLDFYRPRVEGVEPRSAYDSRLLGVISQPEGIFQTVAQTLDYQFGFKISQTWFYRFMEQMIAPLVLFDLITLYLLTCFVVISPNERAFVERFGRYRPDIVEPGAHFKLPWPVDIIRRFPANEVRSFVLGHEGEYTGAERDIWTTKHYEKEYSVLVGSHKQTAVTSEVPDVSLLVTTMTVRYQIKDIKKWYTSCGDPEQMLTALCSREQVLYMASVDMLDVMGPGRARTAVELAGKMNDAVKQLGVEILGVDLEGVHPPVVEGLPQAFHARVAALTERASSLLNEEARAVETIGTAKAEADTIKYAARAYYASRVALAEAQSKRFEVQISVYAGATEVFKAREYLSALQESLGDVRKIVLAVKNLDREHLRIDLQDVGRPELLDSVGRFKTEAGSNK